jgi:hypothetical protein
LAWAFGQSDLSMSAALSSVWKSTLRGHAGKFDVTTTDRWSTAEGTCRTPRNAVRRPVAGDPPNPLDAGAILPEPRWDGLLHVTVSAAIAPTLCVFSEWGVNPRPA